MINKVCLRNNCCRRTTNHQTRSVLHVEGTRVLHHGCTSVVRTYLRTCADFTLKQFSSNSSSTTLRFLTVLKYCCCTHRYTCTRCPTRMTTVYTVRCARVEGTPQNLPLVHRRALHIKGTNPTPHVRCFTQHLLLYRMHEQSSFRATPVPSPFDLFNTALADNGNISVIITRVHNGVSSSVQNMCDTYPVAGWPQSSYTLSAGPSRERV